MYQIPDSITQNEEKKKNNSTERCLKFLSPPYAQIYYCASSLHNHSLFLIPHFELWNNRQPSQAGDILRCKVDERFHAIKQGAQNLHFITWFKLRKI